MSDDDGRGRTLRELAEAAVDASQTPERTLHILPWEYGTLVRQHQYLSHHSSGWDPLVFDIARERGLRLPLPDVRVVVSGSSEAAALNKEGE